MLGSCGSYHYRVIIVKFDLLVDSRQDEVVIALLKDKQLIELHKEPHDSSYAVGDIYLGKVKKKLCQALTLAL